jgi:hypothetical protein
LVTDWYYAKDGAPTGPFSEEVFLKMLAEGSLTRATKVWKEGMSEWTTLGATDLVPKTNATLPPPTTYFQSNRQYGADSAFGRQILRPFNDLASLTNALTLLFYVCAGLAAVAMVSDAWQYHILHTIDPSSMEPSELAKVADSNDSRQQLIGIVQFLMFAGTGVAFLMWLNQANKNIRSLGAENLRFSPDWAVGWWFIPFLCLIRPFQIVTEIWKASASPQSWEQARSDSRITWWWFLFVVMYMFNGVAYRFMENARDIHDYGFGTLLSMFGNMAAIWSALLAAKIIADIWDNQRASRFGRGSHITPTAVARR